MQSTFATAQKYNRPTILFHWVIAILIGLAYLAIEIRGPKGSSSRIFWSNIHYWAGTLVLSLSILRLAWRAYRGTPDALPQTALLTFLSKAVHVVLYIFIFAQPLLGMLTINLGGHPVVLSGLNWSFRLVSPHPDLRRAVQTTHIYLGNTFYAVIGLHALAALWHHFIKRDNTLRRIL